MHLFNLAQQKIKPASSVLPGKCYSLMHCMSPNSSALSAVFCAQNDKKRRKNFVAIMDYRCNLHLITKVIVRIAS
jgi:hypothetical protein